MPTLVDVLVVSDFLRRLRGSSQPVLVRASDGLLYVLKFAHNPQGPNLLFNEVMGTELYRACGLPVPEWRPLLVTDAFLNRNPACWFRSGGESIRPLAGLCFGTRYLGANDDSVLEILPGGYFSRVANRKAFALAWLLDICAQHSDNRQALFLRQPDGHLRAVFFDHGNMFGGPYAAQEPHIVASRYLDARVYDEKLLMGLRPPSDMLDASTLWNLLRALPAEWHSASALESFSTCVARLTDPATIRQASQSMVDLYLRTIHRESYTRQPADRFTAAVLCSGLYRSTRRRTAVA